MAEILQINENIHRVTLPYKDIFTTVYALNTPQGAVLFDAGSFDTDLEAYILPLLKTAGIGKDQLKYVFISHNHKDHSGGLPRLLEAFPSLQIVTHSVMLREAYGPDRLLHPEDGQILLDTFRTVSIPGHTADSAGLLDMRTNTLITGDCLQLAGIRGSGDWASNIPFPAPHRAALRRVQMLEIHQILTAHDYVPYGYRADGKEAVQKMLDACMAPLCRLAALISENLTLADSQIREWFNDPEQQLRINVHVVAAMRAALEEGSWES